MQNLEKLADELRKHAWSIDCVEMKLTRSGSQSPEYVGAGYLRQESNGEIGFKVYPASSTSDGLAQAFPNFGTPGRIIPADRFHRLEAMDVRGTSWQVERTLASPNASLLRSGQYVIVTGEAHEIATTRPQVQDVSTLRMFFFTDAEVPGNASTEVTTVTPDGRTIKSSKLDTAKFSTPFGEFCIYNRPGMIVVEAVSSDSFPIHFESRVLEALSFVLAKALSWNVLETIENNIETVRLRGKSGSINAKIQPPIVSGSIDMSGGYIWKLFAEYLAMVCLHSDAHFHPCSRHLFSVLQASAGTINARGLALGVAVEGLVNSLFPNAGAPPDSLKPDVRRLRRHFRDWEEFSDERIKESLYNRVEAMLGRILDVSAKSRLFALAAENVVYEKHIKSWGDLRHASAHGVTPGSNDLQELVDLCDSVMVLMYHLIFRAVGYEGVYRDYSVHGWGQKYYRGRPPTEEEIAVGAYYLWEKAGKRDGNDVEDWLRAKQDLEVGLY